MGNCAKRVIVVNPLAKSGRALSIFNQLNLDLSQYSIVETEGPGDGILKARKALEEGAQMIIAAGGDGTVHEVVNGMAGSNVTLGILPIGSVNVLAKELGIPSDIQKALDVIENGRVMNMDLAVMSSRDGGAENKKYFVQLGGVGLDAEVVRSVTQAMKNRWGPFSYVMGFMKACRSWRANITVKMRNQTLYQVQSLLIGNGCFYGGAFKIFKKAERADGLLDILIFRGVGLKSFLTFLLSGFRANQKTIQYFQEEEIVLDSNEPIPIELDGEFVGFTPARFHVLARALAVMIPKERARSCPS